MLASVLATPAAPGLHKPTVDLVLARFSEDASWSNRYKDQARAPPPLGPTPRTKDALGHDRQRTPPRAQERRPRRLGLRDHRRPT